MGFSGSGFVWIKTGDSVDGGDCDDGFDVACDFNIVETEKRSAAVSTHRTGGHGE